MAENDVILGNLSFGRPVTRIESFIAKRGGYSFNDLVAAFANAEEPERLPALFPARTGAVLQCA
jgi:hypothetical protein